VIKRLVWFVAGALAGSSATVWAWVRLRRSAARPAAERVASVVAGTARTGADGVRRFVEDARTQVRIAERELRPGVTAGGEQEPDAESADRADGSSQRPSGSGARPGRLTRA